eukprot:CAMPEP_0117877582 /NCGR_PEP_ID=MMETSP0950-20121206/14296_1 /TAXON_ID=44440 /ORGANISM="Chattonella subsalsa, Strain CCMP2191" /LENGTH=143 /DNA_ID=CAMNT_0005731637 /DNA_START=914 /DNA_END=1341 /DNA_ORIENTATION=+
MAESLIILRHAYGLSIDDIVYFSKKVQPPKHVGLQTQIHEEKAMGAWRQLHKLDWSLYKAANETLNNYIMQIGPEKVEEEQKALIQLASNYEVSCSKNIHNSDRKSKENCDCLILDTEEWEEKFGSRFFNLEPKKVTRRSRWG